jgi:hypothetical protein
MGLKDTGLKVSEGSEQLCRENLTCIHEYINHEELSIYGHMCSKDIASEDQ